VAKAPKVKIEPLDRTSWISLSYGWAVPSRFEALVDDPAQPYLLHLVVRVNAGRGAELLAMSAEVRDPTKPGGVTAEGLRAVKVAAAIRLAVQHARKRVAESEPLGAGTFRMEGEPEDTAWGGGRSGPGRGRPIGDEHLQRVAEIYRAAVSTGHRAPVDEVRRQLNTSRSTAGRWVQQAREHHFLGPARGPVAGESDKERNGSKR
jgi:hypothetical protein